MQNTPNSQMPMLSDYQETIMRHLVELRKVSTQPVLSGKHLQNALSQRGDYHTPQFTDAMRFLSDNGYINIFRDTRTSNIVEINIKPKGLNYFSEKKRFEKVKRETESVEQENNARSERTQTIAIYALLLSGLSLIVSIITLLSR